MVCLSLLFSRQQSFEIGADLHIASVSVFHNIVMLVDQKLSMLPTIT